MKLVKDEQMRRILLTTAAIGWAATALAQGADMSLAGGQAVYLPQSETMVRFAAVQDMRCPSAANCIWEGLIRVELELAVPGDPPETLVLCNMCEDATRSAAYGGYTLTLHGLEPGRAVLDPLSRLITLQDYTLILGVEWQ